MLKYLSDSEKQVYTNVCAYIDRYSDHHDLIHEAETGEYIFGGPESRTFIKQFRWLTSL